MDDGMKKKILYLDDEADQIFTLKQLLSDINELEIIGTTSCEECFSILESGSLPDLIFLDIMMNEVSGWEVFDKIRSNASWAHIPIMFLTARTDDIARKAGKFMADSYLEKPVDIIELKEKINELIKK